MTTESTDLLHQKRDLQKPSPKATRNQFVLTKLY